MNHIARRGGAPRRRNAGFTFIEMLTVVGIMGILVAIALPAYQDYVLRAQTAEGLVLLGDAKGAVNEFYARWGKLPPDNAAAGLRAPDALRGKYVRSLTVHDGVLVAALSIGDEHGETYQRNLTFRAWINARVSGAPIVWSCGERVPDLPGDYHVAGDLAPDAVESKWLPSACRK